MMFTTALLALIAVQASANHPQLLRFACEQAFGVGWRGAIHTDDRVICMKVFKERVAGIEGLEKVCAKHNARAAPVANANEQAVIQELLLDMQKSGNVQFDMGVYIGGKQAGNLSAAFMNQEFQWTFDGMSVGKRSGGYQMFEGKEPDNIATSEGNCLAIFSPNENRFPFWFDQYCHVKYTGAACARPLYP